MISIHKTFEKIGGKRTVTFFVCDGQDVQKLQNEVLMEFITELNPTVVRLTAVASLDAFVRWLSDKGCEIQFAHWHNTGIPKNLTPEEIVTQYHALPSSAFRKFTYDAELAKLRLVLDERNAIEQFYGDCVRKLRQTGRNTGNPENDDEVSEAAFAALDDVYSNFNKTFGTNDKIVGYETKIKQLASKNELCKLFNQTAGLSDGSWITSANVVCITQGIERFPRVSDFLSYFGMGDAKLQKRQKGVASNWSARGRLVCYQLGESIIKNRNNPWRDVFDEAKAGYLAKHAETCGCKAAKGHPHAQARRKMVKEILKRFYLAASGIPFDSDHQSVGNHIIDVAVGTAAGE